MCVRVTRRDRQGACYRRYIAEIYFSKYPVASSGLLTSFPHTVAAGANLEGDPVNLTIKLPDEDVQALQAKASARGVSAEQYALEVLEQDLSTDNAKSTHKRFANLSDLLLASPFAGANLDLDRSQDHSRPVSPFST